jgi:hypothetical protein
MALTQALSIYSSEEAKAYLRNVIVGIFENLGAKTVSARLKSKNANLTQAAGSYEFKRFANATSQEYGTARTAAKGQKIIAPSITVNLDTNREIVEEINLFDGQSFTQETFEALVNRRKAAIQLAIERELDRAFFAKIKEQGTAAGINITLTDSIVAQLEDVIVKLVTTTNDYVDGVDRENMALIVSPRLYSKLKTELNDVYNFSGTVEEGTFKGINGVAVFEALRLPEGVDYILLTMDSVAQPTLITGVDVEKIPLSNDYAISVFYRYGTKTLATELALYGAISA